MRTYELLDGAVIHVSGLPDELLAHPPTSVGQSASWEYTSCTAANFDRLLATIGLTRDHTSTSECAGGILHLITKQIEVGSVADAFWAGSTYGLKITGFGASMARMTEMVEALRPDEGPNGLSITIERWEKTPTLTQVIEGLGLVQYYRPGARNSPSLPGWRGTILSNGAEAFKGRVEQGEYLVARLEDGSTLSVVPPPEGVPDLELIEATTLSWSVLP